MFFIFIPRYDSRIRLTLYIFTVLLMALTVRLFYLQVFPSEEVLGNYQSLQSEKISDSEYRLLDTNGKDLLRYNKKYVLVIDKKPFSLNNYEETLEDLMALNFIMKGEDENFNYTDVMKSSGKLYYNISEDAYKKINELENIKGIYTYVYDETDKKEAWKISSILSQIPEKDKVIEDSMEEHIYNLTSKNQEPQKEFSLNDRYIYSKDKQVLVDKNTNIKLTINKDIEEKIREILERKEFDSLKNVGVTIMESDTGKIRAMVQKDETQANVNLSIEGVGYEPGSVFKLITLGAALDKGEVTLSDVYTCKGAICKTPHGSLALEDALVKSCNDCIAKVGTEIGYDTIIEYSKKMGLFSRVLGIQGDGRNEAVGEIPKEEAGVNNISIGQCLTVSPLQILGAANTIVNNGVYIKPFIIESTVDSDDNIIEDFKTQQYRVFSETTSKLMKKAMMQVVLRGTGVNAKVDGITIGGKTGSATSGDKNTHGWFTGFFTIKNKTYTMTVFTPNIEGKGGAGEELGGGNTAAPIFREIVKSLNS
ncbi:penicillin-binding transpeptidase domain-containing protein [Clostridium sp. HBUAS56017]|uniref:peptidoglycan D,D-transpeptidase FtsI family protein n=1 Tax=Clostridium sp. HBUAS56017 TaxID=2571128 RepID=UPI001FA9611F|nr:penicillin-binding transpeptidase domain-containing protein [Clostridium sp. HBUAS56017]